MPKRTKGFRTLDQCDHPEDALEISSRGDEVKSCLSIVISLVCRVVFAFRLVSRLATLERVALVEAEPAEDLAAAITVVVAATTINSEAFLRRPWMRLKRG